MYKLTPAGLVILHSASGLVIPVCPGNRDYDEYQEWITAGNTPAPADPLQNQRIADIKVELATIDAEKIRSASDVSLALVLGAEVPAFAKDKLVALEEKAVPLRVELNALTTVEFTTVAVATANATAQTSVFYAGCLLPAEQ